MEQNRGVISIGSNINPRENIEKSLECLQKKHQILKVSSFLTTKPIGNPNQPDFLNGAVLVETALDFQEFQRFLKEVENSLGRNPCQEDKFGPRIIDLDLVVWNGEIVHSDFWSRSFVRQTVLEVLPQLKLGK
ncbi:MAG: 2-amino-4-hydroxy-6-hydroxymethyldihydropteridine diphosphokinase [Planctomycetota bacterium]|nr:MAG: 2-amino-4-hydroxy-6-hydroxymethyldihydropteridine diphosphokinase [Planctomycetota bacterium]